MSEKLQGFVLFLPTIGGQDAVDVLLDGIVFPHTFFQASIPAENLWVNAELAFGHYTDDIVKQGKKVDSFSRRRIDFCRKLATYLQGQEKRVCIEENEQAFVDGIRHFRSGLTEVQNDAVERSYDLFDGGCTFNFLVFNYTCIIDRFIEAVRKRKIQLGTRVYKNSTYDNSFGKTIHVHGTTRKDMVFGVNDESKLKICPFSRIISLFILIHLSSKRQTTAMRLKQMKKHMK